MSYFKIASYGYLSCLYCSWCFFFQFQLDHISVSQLETSCENVNSMKRCEPEDLKNKYYCAQF